MRPRSQGSSHRQGALPGREGAIRVTHLGKMGEQIDRDPPSRWVAQSLGEHFASCKWTKSRSSSPRVQSALRSEAKIDGLHACAWLSGRCRKASSACSRTSSPLDWPSGPTPVPRPGEIGHGLVPQLAPQGMVGEQFRAGSPPSSRKLCLQHLDEALVGLPAHARCSTDS